MALGAEESLIVNKYELHPVITVPQEAQIYEFPLPATEEAPSTSSEEFEAQVEAIDISKPGNEFNQAVLRHMIRQRREQHPVAKIIRS